MEDFEQRKDIPLYDEDCDIHNVSSKVKVLLADYYLKRRFLGDSIYLCNANELNFLIGFCYYCEKKLNQNREWMFNNLSLFREDFIKALLKHRLWLWGFIIEPQHIVSVGDKTYVIDFYVHFNGKKIAIELDGFDFHKTTMQRTNDYSRQRTLEKLGYEFIRFTGQDVFYCLEYCVNEVIDKVIRG